VTEQGDCAFIDETRIIEVKANNVANMDFSYSCP
jgi:hypothetical protein